MEAAADALTRMHPQRGDDLRLDIEIEFEEAVFGLTKEIKIDHLETCSSCKGTGAKRVQNLKFVKLAAEAWFYPANHKNGSGSFYSKLLPARIVMVKVL